MCHGISALEVISAGPLLNVPVSIIAGEFCVWSSVLEAALILRRITLAAYLLGAVRVVVEGEVVGAALFQVHFTTSGWTTRLTLGQGRASLVFGNSIEAPVTGCEVKISQILADTETRREVSFCEDVAMVGRFTIRVSGRIRDQTDFFVGIALEVRAAILENTIVVGGIVHRTRPLLAVILSVEGAEASAIGDRERNCAEQRSNTCEMPSGGNHAWNVWNLW